MERKAATTAVWRAAWILDGVLAFRCVAVHRSASHSYHIRLDKLLELNLRSMNWEQNHSEIQRF